MTWLHKIAETQFWHATTSDKTEEIRSQNAIKPDMLIEEETGSSNAGWGFSEQVGKYGDGVYLATTAELALYYANLRLRSERDEVSGTISTEEDEIRLYDENVEYLGLFRVFIKNLDNLVPNDSRGEEFKYRGVITNQVGSNAWYEWVNWVSRTRDADRWRQRLE